MVQSLYKLQRFWLFRGSSSSEDGRLQRLKAENIRTSENVPDAEHVPELGLP
ncbi:hypothetical protein A2U01_0074160, partial [Trifolium medium]|nr:hypothetical protein [Trifolium medium]